MGNAAIKLISKKGKDKMTLSAYKTLQEVPIKPLLPVDAAESPIGSLCEGKKAILCVNVASKWGLTDKNYKQLVQMYEELESEGL